MPGSDAGFEPVTMCRYYKYAVGSGGGLLAFHFFLIYNQIFLIFFLCALFSRPI